MKDFKHYIKIKATPEDVYACLTNPFTIGLWSGLTARMEAVEGADFEMFDGDIAGKFLKLETDKLVQQEWYFGEQEDPSIVTIKIHDDKNGVSVELRHSNIPDEAYAEITNGWEEYYLGKIKSFLEL